MDEWMNKCRTLDTKQAESCSYYRVVSPFSTSHSTFSFFHYLSPFLGIFKTMLYSFWPHYFHFNHISIFTILYFPITTLFPFYIFIFTTLFPFYISISLTTLFPFFYHIISILYFHFFNHIISILHFHFLTTLFPFYISFFVTLFPFYTSIFTTVFPFIAIFSFSASFPFVSPYYLHLFH